MRWKKPQEGQTRNRIKFAWCPITIGDETRWLEWVRFEECRAFRYPHINIDPYWKKVKFLEYTPRHT